MLQVGDKIGICAPSGSFDRRRFDNGLETIARLGFETYVPEEIYRTKRYLAGDDSERAEVINHLFLNSEINGIMCARGGFGSMRVLPHLNWQAIKANPKPFVGFSDLSALLVNLVKIPASLVVHGPVVTSLADSRPETAESLLAVLISTVKTMTAKHPLIVKEGRACGILSGGNLSTLNHLVGTRFQPNFNGCILLLEDTGEAPYKIDRMLSQMKMAGCFRDIKGIALGVFENCHNFNMVLEIVEETFYEEKIPVMGGFEVGHGRINLSLPFGRKAVMDTKEAGLKWDL